MEAGMILNRKDALEFFLLVLLAGVLLGYTLGLLLQAIWKTKFLEREKCELKQQHSW